MASMMKTLINEFYELQRDSDDFEYRMTLDFAVSAANNCHGMTSENTLNVVESTLEIIVNTDKSLGESGKQAIADAQIVVDMYREKLNSSAN